MVYFGLSNAAFLLAFALLGAWFDQVKGDVPGWLAGLGAVLGCCLNFYLSGSPGLVAGWWGLVIALVVYFPLWRIGVVQAGAVKLMAAIGAVCGPRNWVIVFLFVALLGVPTAALLAFSSKQASSSGITKGQLVRELLRFLPPYAKKDELSLHRNKLALASHGLLVLGGVALFLSWTLATS